MTLLTQQLPTSMAQASKSALSDYFLHTRESGGEIPTGKNTELKDMLSDNVALAKRLRESMPNLAPFGATSRFREVSDPIS